MVTTSLKNSDYLRISFLLFYNIGAYAGIQIRNKVLKKEYRKTDMRHIKIVNEILDRKKILLVILIIQLLITILLYILFLKDGELFDTNFFVFIAAYILFALAPLLSLALQYEVSKDNEFFNKFTSGTTKDFKMDDYPLWQDSCHP